MDFTILQWNARSFTANKSYIEHTVSEMDISVLAISETWFHNYKHYTLKGYSTVRQDRNDGKGGAALFIKRSVPYNTIQIKLGTIDPNKCQICGLSVRLNNLNLNIVSIYVIPKYYINIHQWNELLTHLPKPVIICGDFNSHHMSWGCNFIDKYGTNLIDAIDINNLVILNNGNPTLRFKNNLTAVDISVCSPELAHRIDWEVSDDTLGSDHYAIILRLKNCVVPYRSVSGWNCKKADWRKYEMSMEQDMLGFESINDKSDYARFINIINNAADKSIPKKQNISKGARIKPVWWDEECDQLVKDRRHAEKTYRKSSTYINFVICQNLNLTVRKIFKKKKKDSWVSYVSSINPSTSSKEVFGMIKRFKNMAESTTHENILPKVAEKIIEFYSPAGAKYDIDNRSHHSTQRNCEILLQPFSLWELNTILRNNSDTAPAKFKDRLIKRRLEWWVKKNDLLPKSQFGFRRGMGVNDNLAIFITDLWLSINRNNYMVCLFSDIKRAYDNVVPGILYDTLYKIGLPKKFVRAITSTVFERDVYYKINNRMIGPRKMYKGLPQGGILSPILYALYVRDIEHIWEQGTKILQYADDVLIYIEKTSLQDAIDTMSRNIENFDKWLVSKGLELSSEKSSIGIITRHRDMDFPTRAGLIKTDGQSFIIEPAHDSVKRENSDREKKHIIYSAENNDKDADLCRVMSKL
ncbi:uncharacterized protein LOC113383695 [Ctenocephalides felis]|uniref:uncharacterized protein LOC113383695 n=1 Tax=Ctenocephalides felis TaxID=7515 RepID=UPI000E6E28DA|nr:uncharacterized protein LOC113383695 [Ctenocephalides felis]